MTPLLGPGERSATPPSAGIPADGARVTGAGGRPGSGPGAAVALSGWAAFLAGAIALLHGVGGALAPPPLSDPGRLGLWVEQRQPAEAAFAVVRLVALGLAWYLLVVIVAGTVARVIGARSLVRVADAVSLPVVRRLVSGAVGVSFTAAALAGAGTAALADEHGGPPGTVATAEIMRRLPDVPPTSLPLAPAEPPPPPAGGTGGAEAVGAPPGGGGPRPRGELAPAAEGTWRVRPGDHFWAVAERVLATAWGRTPVDDEVDAYWRTLVATNVGMLRDPGNPDLLFADQVIALPAPPPPPSRR